MNMIHLHDEISMLDLDDVNVIESNPENSNILRFCFKNGDDLEWIYNSIEERNKAWELIKKLTRSTCIDINKLTL